MSILSHRPLERAFRAGLFGRSSTPLTILGSSLKGWWDFSDAASLFQLSNGTTAVAADADPIGYATDKGSAGAHLVQATAGSRFTYKAAIQNGRSVGRSDGTADFLQTLTSITSQPDTIFVVASIADADNHVMFDGGDNTHRQYSFKGIVTPGALEMGSSVNFGAAHTAGAFHVYEFTFNGASSEILIDGVSLVTGDGGSHDLTAGFTLAASFAGGFFAAADYGDVVVASGSLSAALRTSMRAMLKSKWGTP